MIDKIGATYIQRVIDWLWINAKYLLIGLLLGGGLTYLGFKINTVIQSIQDLKQESANTAKKSDIVNLAKDLRHEIDTSAKATNKKLEDLERSILRVDRKADRNRDVLSRDIERSNISTKEKIEEIKELYSDEKKITI